MNARLLGLGGALSGFVRIAVAQRHHGGQRQALGGGRLAEEFRHPPLAEQLPPCRLAAQELAELRHHQGSRRVEVGAGIENDIGAFDVAGENQQLGKQDPGADVGRRLAHRGIGRRQGVGQVAFPEQAAGLARACGTKVTSILLYTPPGAASSVTTWKAAATSSS